ncbi:YbaK/EbsC family protein [soil metagenome]
MTDNCDLASEKSTDQSLERFNKFVRSSGISVQIIYCGAETVSVQQAADAIGCEPREIIKTLLFHNKEGTTVVAIAAGLSRIEVALLSRATGFPSLKLARPDFVFSLLGYPAGGVPPIGLPQHIRVIVDESAAALDYCYGGAGTVKHLARFSVDDIVRLNGATVAPIAMNPTPSPFEKI